jgi:exo-1,4-beta-D-glucosaminidase
MDERYGAPQNLADFSLRSQVMTYANARAMFEASRRNKYNSTGVIQWMLNNAWPGLIWHLYDYYLVPGGGYFGAKKANEPVHALYGYDDNAVWLVNNLYNAVPQAKLTISVLNLDLSEKFSQ